MEEIREKRHGHDGCFMPVSILHKKLAILMLVILVGLIVGLVMPLQALAASGSHRAMHGTGPTTLTDTIAYTGATPGKEYTLTTTMHAKNAAGSDAGVLKGTDGKDVTSSATFTPEKESGTVSVDVGIDTDAIPLGTALVAYNSIAVDGQTVASHEDITDLKFTVLVTDEADTGAADAGLTADDVKAMSETGDDSAGTTLPDGSKAEGGEASTNDVNGTTERGVARVSSQRHPATPSQILARKRRERQLSKHRNLIPTCKRHRKEQTYKESQMARASLRLHRPLLANAFS